jgi:hypothetical protein
MRYQTTVEVDAIQYVGYADDIAAWADEVMGSHIPMEGGREKYEGHLLIATPHGAVYLAPGQWLVRSCTGRLLVVPPGEFAETYQPVEETV